MRYACVTCNFCFVDYKLQLHIFQYEENNGNARNYFSVYPLKHNLFNTQYRMTFSISSTQQKFHRGYVYAMPS